MGGDWRFFGNDPIFMLQMYDKISFHTISYTTLHQSTFCFRDFFYYNITFQFALRRCLAPSQTYILFKLTNTLLSSPSA